MTLSINNYKSVNVLLKIITVILKMKKIKEFRLKRVGQEHYFGLKTTRIHIHSLMHMEVSLEHILNVYLCCEGIDATLALHLTITLYSVILMFIDIRLRTKLSCKINWYRRIDPQYLIVTTLNRFAFIVTYELQKMLIWSTDQVFFSLPAILSLFLSSERYFSHLQQKCIFYHHLFCYLIFD